MNYKGGNSKFNPKINLPLRKNDGIINIKAINANRNVIKRHMLYETVSKNDSSIHQDSDHERTDDHIKLSLKPINCIKKVKSHSEPRRNMFTENNSK